MGHASCAENSPPLRRVGSYQEIIELTDKVRTDANGEVKLNFDPSKTVGRSITYMIVGDVISPFEHFNLKIQSRKQHLMLIKGWVLMEAGRSQYR